MCILEKQADTFNDGYPHKARQNCEIIKSTHKRQLSLSQKYYFGSSNSMFRKTIYTLL